MKTAKTTKANASRKGSTAGAKAGRAKLAIIERLQALGLLEQTWAERLEKKAEAVMQPTGDSLEKAAAWDRELYAGLVAFEAQGGDGNMKKSLQPMLAWNETLMETPDTPAGLGLALTGLKKILPFHGASLHVRNPDRKQVELTAVCGFEVELISRIRFTEGNGFSSWVASKKKPVLYASIHRNEAPGSEQIRSFMSVPLVACGECVGVLNVGHREENAYELGHLRRLILASGLLTGLVQRFVAAQQIRAREIHNPVTGLATATYLGDRLHEEVVRCRELGYSMSLLLLRLNELDEYAEQFGEEFRERVSLELCRLVCAWKLPTELVGHREGDALVAVLPGARTDKALARAECLAAAIQKHNFPRRKKMSLGFGIAAYPTDAEDPQELLAVVDKALKDKTRPRAGFEGVAQPLAA